MSLISWMEDDPYGFCHDLERGVVKVRDKKGLAAFIQQIRAKFEPAPTRDDEKKRFSGYERQRWGGVLKTLLAAQRNVDAYIALCNQTGLAAKDCIAIAEIYKSRRRAEEAPAWVERGLKIARADSRSSYEEHELGELKRAMLADVRRGTFARRDL